MFIAQWFLILKHRNRRGKIISWMAAFSAVALGIIVTATLGARAGGPAEGSARHAVVISVDGLGASWSTVPRPNLRIGNLRRLMEEGSYAEGVVGVYPSVTYPSHTTLVTGCRPAGHGVYSNLSSREAGQNPDDWFWSSSAIKVPTLWDELRRAGMSSAAVSWPVTAGAAIDWNLPEVWEPGKGEVADYQYIAKFATPGLIEEVLAVLGPPEPGTDDDTVRTRFAAYLLTKYKPNLLLVHLADLDAAEHDYGSESTEAAATLERADKRIGELLDVVKGAGLEGSTDIFIVSDHGFLPIEREIRPNVLLVKAGLLEAGGKGVVTGGKVFTLAQGGAFFIYWPESLNLRAQVDAALKPLRDEGVLWGVLNRQALADLGAEPAIQMALEAPSGAAFSRGADGEIVIERAERGGTHGYLPFRPGLEASFIAWGPGIKRGVNLHRIPMVAIAPTILKALGIENPKFGEHPPLSDILTQR